MFKTLAFTIVAGLVLVSPVTAQEEPPSVVPLAILATCSDKATAMALVDKWEEIPFVGGNSITQMFPSNQTLPGKLKMFANPSTWSWSLFITDPSEKLWCLVTSGESLAVGSGDSI